MKRLKKSLLVTSFLLAVFVGSFFYLRSPSRGTDANTASETSLQSFTIQDLARYDGSSTTLPIYIGLDGYVYDVSAGKNFYLPGAIYHYLAGKDSSKSLHIMGGETIKQKYPIIGILEK